MTLDKQALDAAKAALWDEFCPGLSPDPNDDEHYAKGAKAAIIAYRGALPKGKFDLLATVLRSRGKFNSLHDILRAVDAIEPLSKDGGENVPNEAETPASAGDLPGDPTTLTTLQEEVKRLEGLLRRVPDAMHGYFSAGGEEREGGSANRQEKLMRPGDALLAELRTVLKSKGE